MGVQVFFPGENDLDQELITIVGRESDVKKARLELEKAIKDLVSCATLLCYHSFCG